MNERTRKKIAIVVLALVVAIFAGSFFVELNNKAFMLDTMKASEESGGFQRVEFTILDASYAYNAHNDPYFSAPQSQMTFTLQEDKKGGDVLFCAGDLNQRTIEMYLSWLEGNERVTLYESKGKLFLEEDKKSKYLGIIKRFVYEEEEDT